MAGKGNWMAEAFGKHPGAFTKKAKAAGEGTIDFAHEKADAPGKTGKQARLALLGKKFGGGARKQAAALRHPGAGG